MNSSHSVSSHSMSAHMDASEYAHKLEELDHMLHDDDVAPPPQAIWALLADLTRHDVGGPTPAGAAG